MIPIPETGSWRVTEVGLREDGEWQVFDEGDLAAAGFDLRVEVVDNTPGVGGGVESIHVQPRTDTLTAIGDTVRFIATAYDRFENIIEVGGFEWSSSDGSVATVDQSGLVTATGWGEATIVVELDDHRDEVTINVIEPVVWKFVTSGGQTSCGVTDKDITYCWGYNGYGKVGDGVTTAPRVTTPKRVSGNHVFKALAIGSYHVVGLTTTGELYAWGRNSEGELGDGTNIDSTTPVRVDSDLTFSQISASGDYTLALTTDGVAYAWGGNSNAQLGDSTTISRNLPTPVKTDLTFASISAGLFHAMALTADGEAWGWGRNTSGNLGAGTGVSTGNQRVPVKTVGGNRFVEISAGVSHTLARTSSGQVFAWGSNSNGQLGVDPSELSFSQDPVLVGGLPSIVSISAGSLYSTAVDAAGVVYTWGEGANGALGDGTEVDRYQPAPIHGDLDVISIVATGRLYSTVMTLTRDGAIYGWGENDMGGLGDGTTQKRLLPVRVLEPEE
jgi:alpha-tubulin suppressor-like RCC1 family protein